MNEANEKVRLKDISFGYSDEFLLLKDINLSVKSGQLVNITGRCGSGKSTLAKIICGLLKPLSGCLEYLGLMPLMIFQNPDNQFVRSRVEDDVAFGPENLGISPDEIKERVARYADFLNIKKLLGREISTLSSSEKVQVAVCGALCTGCSALVFDEVNAFLDRKGREDISLIIRDCLESGMAVINFTHSPQLIFGSSDTFLLENGHLWEKRID